jgi:AcrR family transcriptional regulator
MVQLDPTSSSKCAVALPMAGQHPERADAAANRERILCAARRLLREHGPDALTMQAVASAAGVGKGTVFRRFGDRESLTHALLDDYMREFQEAFLHGPPPLGPGAPPEERLEAFVVELVRLQADHLQIALAAEAAPGRAPGLVYGPVLLHIATLVKQIDPTVDERLVAGFILNAIAPAVLHRMTGQLDADTPKLQDAARALLRGLTRSCAKPPTA